MKLSNVTAYLAQALDVPEAAIVLQFRWPHKGKMMVEKNDSNSTLTHLRTVWRTQ